VAFTPHHTPSRSATGARLAAVAVLLVLLLGGAYLILSHGPSGQLAGIDLVVLLTVVWFVVVSAGIARVGEYRRELALPLRVRFLVVAIAGSAFYVWDTWLRPKSETNEQIVQAPAASAPAQDGAQPGSDNQLIGGGAFEGVDGHSASGRAQLIEVAGGKQVVTFDDFEVDQGPDLRVYLVEGEDVSGGNFVDLGSLKGEKGRFQYELDEPVDPERYTHVVVWCRAFSVGFGRAPLEPS
jgi:hypothetical protein